MKHYLKEAFLVFLVFFAIYTSNAYSDFAKDTAEGGYRNLATSADVVPNTFLPYILVNHQTFYFDEIKNRLKNFQSIKEQTPYFLLKVNDNYVSVYPPLTGILALPIFYVPLILKVIPALNLWDYMLKMLVLGRIAASFYTALSVVLVYFILKTRSQDKKLIWLFTILYAIGTCTYSISSRSLWQHTSSEFLTALTVLLLLYAAKKPNLLPLIGFVVGLIVLARPTSILLAAAIALYVLISFKKGILSFAAGAAPCAAFLLVYNFVIYGSPFVEGYAARNNIVWSTPFFTGLAGFLFSPSRSFIFVTPPLVLTWFAIFKTFKDRAFGKEHNTLLRWLSIGFLAEMFMFSKWFDWSGANGFGYRMLTDFLPILILLSFEAAKKFSKPLKIILAILVVYSILIQINAVFVLRSRCSEKHNYDFECVSITDLAKLFK